jgi:C_GCAxxG_C_C family probable redox protein
LNVGSPEVFKAGTALAGGIALHGETCGALSGAIMALGSLIGRERLEDMEKLDKAMKPAGRIYTLFKEKIGHTLCLEIHKIYYGKSYRLFIPEEMEAFQKVGGHSREGCPKICGIAARIAGDVILDIVKK